VDAGLLWGTVEEFVVIVLSRGRTASPNDRILLKSIETCKRKGTENNGQLCINSPGVGGALFLLSDANFDSSSGHRVFVCLFVCFPGFKTRSPTSSYGERH
jgi:hypothetical protein